MRLATFLQLADGHVVNGHIPRSPKQVQPGYNKLL